MGMGIGHVQVTALDAVALRGIVTQCFGKAVVMEAQICGKKNYRFLVRIGQHKSLCIEIIMDIRKGNAVYDIKAHKRDRFSGCDQFLCHAEGKFRILVF